MNANPACKKGLHVPSRDGLLDDMKTALGDPLTFYPIDPYEAINSSDAQTGDYPLTLAAKNGHTEVAFFLLQSGAMSSPTDKVGCTPLHYAAQRGFTQLVELLLEAGAPIDAQNTYGETALHYASRSGHHDVVQLLMDKGAPIQASTRGGFTALHYASGSTANDAVKIAKSLNGNGSDPARQTDWGDSALDRAMIAKAYDNGGAFEYLMEARAKSSKGKRGATPKKGKKK